MEEGMNGEVKWVIEKGEVGGVKIMDFEFGCE